MHAAEVVTAREGRRRHYVCTCATHDSEYTTHFEGRMKLPRGRRS